MKFVSLFAYHHRSSYSAASAVTALSCSVLLFSSAVYAQHSTLDNNALLLEEEVVTAQSQSRSLLDSSAAIYKLSGDRIYQSVARSTGEIFRSIPGFRSESSSGDSFLSLSVRGIPSAISGGKYTQIQEDGLAVLQFGDILNASADAFIMYDQTIAGIEAIKGGSAATLASNAPGGIINFISKKGQVRGGSLIHSLGADYNSRRIDYNWGTPIGSSGWSIHFGGFLREGEGVRDVDFNAERGGQFKFGAYKEFADRGSLYLYARQQDTKSPIYFASVTEVGGDAINGYDHLQSANIAAGLRDNFTSDLDIAARGVNNVADSAISGVRDSDIADGFNAESSVLGADFSWNFGPAAGGIDNVLLDAKLRIGSNSGSSFGNKTYDITPVTITNGTAQFPGNFPTPVLFVGATPVEVTHLNNPILQNLVSIDNDIESLDNFVSDIAVTLDFANTPGVQDLSLTMGLYSATQDININSYWQNYQATVADEPRLVRNANEPGNPDVAPLATFGKAYNRPNANANAYRHTELDISLTALYAMVDLDITENLSMNFALRYDSGDADGGFAATNNIPLPPSGAGDLSILRLGATSALGTRAGSNYDFEAISALDYAASDYEYDYNYVSYSVGLNWIFAANSALFFNLSQGTRASADGLADGGYINFVTSAGVTAEPYDDAIENTVSQFDFGIKHQQEHFSILASLFMVNTEDVSASSSVFIENVPADFDGTGSNRKALSRDYESSGLEIEIAAHYDIFDLRTSLTFIDAEITDAANRALIGNTPARQADLIYTITPSFLLGAHTIGLNLIGTSDSFSDDANTEDLEMDGYAYVNFFANLSIIPDVLSFNVGVNNLFDTVGITQIDGAVDVSNPADGTADYWIARSIAGRSTNISLRYDF